MGVRERKRERALATSIKELFLMQANSVPCQFVQRHFPMKFY